MRAPFRSESDAFRFTLGGAGTVAVSVLVGWLTDPWVGLGVFSLAVVRRRHVLVVANQPLAGSDLRERIFEQDDGDVLVDVLAPVLTSRIHYAMSDIDRELADAGDRLERSLAWAREQGIAVRGTLGDPSPTTAIEDELRRFGADEVIVATHPSTSQTWQERDELERLRRELEMPVTHVVVGDDRADEPAR